MKAGFYLGKEQVEIQDPPLPEVGDNDVLVQNLYSSVFGTDMAVFAHGPNTGHKVTVGGEFGHETVSRRKERYGLRRRREGLPLSALRQGRHEARRQRGHKDGPLKLLTIVGQE